MGAGGLGIRGPRRRIFDWGCRFRSGSTGALEQTERPVARIGLAVERDASSFCRQSVFFDRLNRPVGRIDRSIARMIGSLDRQSAPNVRRHRRFARRFIRLLPVGGLRPGTTGLSEGRRRGVGPAGRFNGLSREGY